MSAKDILWIHRFNHFNKALLLLQEATAAQIVSAIRGTCFAEFDRLRIKLEGLKKEEEA